MTDCFIIHCSDDERLAQWVHGELLMQGVSALLARAPGAPGGRWSPGTIESLREATWIVVLASRAACRSAYRNRMVEEPFLMSRNVLSVIWDTVPSRLPGWLRECGAVNVRTCSPHQLRCAISAVTGGVAIDGTAAAAAVRAVGAGLLALRLLEQDPTVSPPSTSPLHGIGKLAAGHHWR